MATIKISEMTAAGSLTGDEIVPVLKNGVNVKTTAQDIANLNSSASPQFVDLDGDEWDFTVAQKVRILLTADRAITLSGTVSGESVGLFKVIQDETGGWALTVNDTEIAINDGADEKTLGGFSDTGDGDIMFSTDLGGGAGSPVSYTDIVYDDLVNMEQSPGAKQWRQTPAAGAGWVAGGRDTVNIIASGADFRALSKVVSGKGMNAFMGVKTTAVTPVDVAPAMLLGVRMDDAGSLNNIVKIENTTQAALPTLLINGGWFGFQRIASVWSYIKSADGVTIDEVAPSDVTHNGACYFVVIGYDQDDAIIDTPKFSLL